MSGAIVGALILWVVPIFVSHSQGKAKHRSGALYGIFLGWLGVLILAVLPAVGSGWSCPWCAEDIKPQATICPHCRQAVSPIDA